MTAAADAGALSRLPGRISNVDFSEFFRHERKSLVLFVMSLGANGDEATEITEIAFVKAFPLWDTIRYPKAWLRRVAQNELSRSRRAGRREISSDRMPDLPAPVSAALEVELDEEAREVSAALGALPPKQRQVMAWILDGFTNAEIARELGVSQESVRQNHSKGVKNLRRLLGSAKREAG